MIFYVSDLRNSVGKLAGKFDDALRRFEAFIDFGD
jgi:hypothetical protein